MSEHNATEKSIWNKTISSLEQVVQSQNYQNWIKPLVFSHTMEDMMYIVVPDQFFKEWLEDNYIDLISSALSVAAGKDMSVVFILSQEESILDLTEKITEKNIKKIVENKNYTKNTELINLNPKYTFDQFVIGAGNQFAHAASIAVANNPAITYNPLFIYGGVGLGKSHLLHAIGHKISDVNKEFNIYYCSAEKFMTEMVTSIKLNKMDEFRYKYRSIDVLLIDDIQFIAKKERTQTEFFHTFNALYELNKQIVITSDKFPKEIDIEDRLRSRFEWGLIADIQEPDFETKFAILKKKSEINKIRLPDDVAEFLASSNVKNIRELEGMLIRLGAYSSLQHVPITLQMAKNNLKNIIISKHKEITIDLIQKVVADFYCLKVSDLKSEKRLKTFVQARQMAIWLSRDMTTASFPDIGSRFGGKDHSTVIHAVKKIDKLRLEDHNTAKTLEDLRDLIQC
jgi:chromosomal replication initiator protein